MTSIDAKAEMRSDTAAAWSGTDPHLTTPQTSPSYKGRLRRAVEGVTGGKRQDGLWSAGSLLAGLLLWEVLGHVLDLRFLPPFSGVAIRLYELTVGGVILGDLGRSLISLLLGYSIAIAVSVPVGIAMGRFKVVEKALDPFVYGFLTAPAIAFVPIYFTVFGLSRWAIVTLIVHYSVFIMIINTCTAAKSVSNDLIEMSTVFGASRLATFRTIVVRASLPLIMAGWRVGAARSVKAMINGELLIAVVGLGATSARFGRAFDSEGVLAMLMLIIIVALVFVRLVRWVDETTNSWLPDARSKRSS